MTYLLVTNTCINYLTGRSAKLLQRMTATPPHEIALCSIVKAELLYGAAHSADPVKERAKLQPFFVVFTSLPFDDRCAEEYGEIRAHLATAGMPIGPYDLLIAATARAHAITLVTHNTRECGRVPGLSIDDWQV
jgi:tRNA(fMet)-specific endonuclease VapC